MDCARYESELARWLGGESVSAEVRAALRRHAEVCEACAGSADLLDLAELPVADRDPIVAPDGYGDTFQTRLDDRLRREVEGEEIVGVLPRDDAAVGVRPGFWRPWAVAASVALALGALWLVGVARDGESGPAGATATEGQGAVLDSDAWEQVWAELAPVLEAAEDEELRELIDVLPVAGSPGRLPGVLDEEVDLDDRALDAQGKRELLEWLGEGPAEEPEVRS